MGAAKWADGLVTWEDDNILYVSVVFTWRLQRAERIVAKYRAKNPSGRVIAGGPAVYLLGAPWADEVRRTAEYDVLEMHNPEATFTTRGCIRRCEFCAVPKIEGKFRELDTWKIAPLVCDNNLLAASKDHFAKVMKSLHGLANVDFNQGLDARIFTRWHAEQIATIGRPVIVRFALDHSSSIDAVGKAIEIARGAGLKEIRVYVLVGFKDTPEDAKERLDFLMSIRVKPYPMRYQPLDALEKDLHITPEWTHQEILDFRNYYHQGIHCSTGVTLERFKAKRSLLRLRHGDNATKRAFRSLSRRKKNRR